VRHRSDAEAALRFLREQGASERLLQHAQLVHQTAEQLLTVLGSLGVELDAETVLAGAVLHDAGKIRHPEELHAPGCRHEEAGRQLLMGAGYDPRIARICVSHGQWDSMECSLEELVVALADKLWKGKREEALERVVVQWVASAVARQPWEVFQILDTAFEELAAAGHDRLLRTQAP
jgi:putative nucleotidyltransferase with HDIG domain